MSCGRKKLRMHRASSRSVPLARQDPEVASIVRDETGRQVDQLELIASENYCSVAVREAVGSLDPSALDASRGDCRRGATDRAANNPTIIEKTLNRETDLLFIEISFCS